MQSVVAQAADGAEEWGLRIVKRMVRLCQAANFSRPPAPQLPVSECFRTLFRIISFSPVDQLSCSIVSDACRCSHAFRAFFVAFSIRNPLPGAAVRPPPPRFRSPQHQQTPPSCLLHSCNPPPALALPETQIAHRTRGDTQKEQLPAWTPRQHGGDGLAV